MNNQIYLSKHAKERLRERHDRHLLKYTNKVEFDSSCYKLLEESTFANRHLNDSMFLMFLHENYGYEKIYSFKEYKNVLFVIIENTVVTVLDAKLMHTRQFKMLN